MSNFYKMIERLPGYIVEQGTLNAAIEECKYFLECENSTLGYDLRGVELAFELHHGVSIEEFQEFMTRKNLYAWVDERMKEELILTPTVEPKDIYRKIWMTFYNKYQLTLVRWSHYSSGFKTRQGCSPRQYRIRYMRERLPNLTLQDFVERLACCLLTDTSGSPVIVQLRVFEYKRKASLHVLGPYGKGISTETFTTAFIDRYGLDPVAYFTIYNKTHRQYALAKQELIKKEREKRNLQRLKENQQRQWEKREANERKRRQKQEYDQQGESNVEQEEKEGAGFIETMVVRLKAPYVTLDTLVTHFDAMGTLPEELSKEEARSWLAQVFENHIGMSPDEYQRHYQIRLSNTRLSR